MPSSFDASLDSPGLAQVLLSVSLTGTLLLQPLYAADGTTITDFAWVHLNEAAQQLLRLPERPAASFLTLFPAASQVGVFQFYQDAFRSGRLVRRQNLYQHDGLDGYYHLVAQRHEQLLIVNFTDSNDRDRSAVEQALRTSQAREQAAMAEAELQRQRLQALVDQAPVAIGYFEGSNLHVTAANPLLSALWGRQQAEVLGRPLLEGVPELRGQGFEDLMRQVRETGVPFVGTEAPAQLLRDGRLTTTYYNFVYQPLYDAQGNILGIIDVAVEVTEQVLARQQVQDLNQELAASNEELRASNEEYLLANTALSDAQQQLRQLNEQLEIRVQERTTQLLEQQKLLGQILRQVPAYVATLDGPQHRFTFANDRYQQLVAGRAELGKPVADALPEAVEQGFIGLLDQVYTSGQPYAGREVSLLLAQAEGPARQHYLDFTYQPLPGGLGQPQGILAFAVDVTEQVRARRQADALQAATLAVAQRQAQERQDLYQLFEQTPTAIVLLRELDHRIEYFNPAFATFFLPGQTPGSLRGLPLAQAYPRMQEAGLVRLLDQVYTTGEPQVVLEMPLADLQPGSPRYVTFAYQAYREDDQIVGVAAFIYDATEQVLARQQVQDLNEELATINEELHESNAQLLHTNADLDNFIYTASHDLKSPISNIEGLLEALPHVLPEAVRESAEVGPILRLMRSSIERFTRTIAHLTDLTRLQAEFAQPAEPTSLAAIVEDVRQDLLPQLSEAGAALEVAVNGTQPRVFSPKNLRSIVYNLLSNAVKYRAPARAPRVRISCVAQGSCLVLQVQDNGLGLDERQQGRLFQLFQRLHTHVEGTGVGLYAVKKIVDNAGGTIAVQSELDVGTTFTLTFPA